MISQKKLPLGELESETYQDTAFVLGILCGNERVKEVFRNSFVNIYCRRGKKLEELGLRFCDVTWEDYRQKGVFEMSMFRFDCLVKEKFSCFLIDLIDQGNYILLYSIDEFYLPYSEVYYKRHFVHDTYIFGYEGESFWVQAYICGKIGRFLVPMEAITEGCYSSYKNMTESSFCTIKIPLSVQKADRDLFFYEINCYCNSSKEAGDEKVYAHGREVYSTLQTCINELIISGEKMDSRQFRLLWENKKIVLGHLKYYFGDEWRELIDAYENVVEYANRLFFLSIKYSLTPKISIIRKISDYLEKMDSLEQRIFFELLSLHQEEK